MVVDNLVWLKVEVNSGNVEMTLRDSDGNERDNRSKSFFFFFERTAFLTLTPSGIPSPHF